MGQRGSPTEVFIRRISVEDLGLELSFGRVREQAIRDPANGVGLLHIGEGKDIGRIEETSIRLSVSGRLDEAMIETASTGSSNVGNNPVEGWSPLFILVETEVQKGSEKPPALGTAESECTIESIAGYGQGLGGVVLEVRDHVPDGNHAQPDQRRILGNVDHFVDLARLESPLERNVGDIGSQLPISEACKLPP